MDDKLILEDSNGRYVLRRTYTYTADSVKYNMKTEDTVVVTMFDTSARLPVIWSRGMTKEQAIGAVDFFRLVGYFDMPLSVEYK